jgi:hypothetical protein
MESARDNDFTLNEEALAVSLELSHGEFSLSTIYRRNM